MIPHVNTMAHYNLTRSFDIGGGDKGVSLRSLVDVVEKRAMLIASKAMAPETPEAQTNLLRGQYLELQLLSRALREIMPGLDSPNFNQSPMGTENV
jgi:hypothetical protein